MNRHDKRKATVGVRVRGQKEAFLEQLRKTPIIQLAADKASVGRTTVYRWRDEDPEFAEQMEQAIQEGRLLVSDVAEAQILAAIRDRNIPSVLFWLKHHHPSYSTKIEIDATIKKEAPELTAEQWALIEEALSRVPLPDITKDNGDRHGTDSK